MSGPSQCRAKNPRTCRHHGAYQSPNGRPTPRPWRGMDSRPRKAREGKTVYHTRQLHGFQNEFRVCSENNLLKVDNYTFRWDAYTRSNTPVSIKTKRVGGDIELGDFFRQAEHDQDFYLHVSFWSQDKDNVVDERVVLIPGSYWKSLFPHRMHQRIREVLADSSPDPEYDQTWSKNIAELREEWGTDSPIRLRPKRDHKGQIRMQCAINHREFMNMVKQFSVDSIV